MRVALVHDYLNQYGGAEKVLEALHDLYPAAPVYTSVYRPGPDARPFPRLDDPHLVHAAPAASSAAAISWAYSSIPPRSSASISAATTW